MGDINKQTEDTTLYDENGNVVAVSLNALSGIYELRTKDKDVYDILKAGSVSKNEWQNICELGKGFSVTTTITTISGSAETDFMLFRNPTGSTITIELDSVYYFATKGNGILRVYEAPTVTTVGTALGINKQKLGGAISSQALVYINPTISARGGLRRVLGTVAYTPLIVNYDMTVVIPPNNDLLFTVHPSANNTDHAVGVSWGEE